jgi:mevalonate kinase
VDKTIKKYPSKILLIGEYTVTHGGQALAVPSFEFWGQWVKKDSNATETQVYGLKKLISHIENSLELTDIIDVKLLRRCIDDGYRFESNIPYGCGLGSSGALIACVYDLFVKQEHRTSDLAVLISQLGALESAFHGNSSGIDPMISYLQKVVKVINNQPSIESSLVEMDSWQLYNTGLPRQTGPLVAWYKSKFENKTFVDAMDSLKNHNNAAISAIMNNNRKLLIEQLEKISRLQFEHLKKLIPTHIQEIWWSEKYLMKLCGAGGGGMMLQYKL